MKYGHFDDLNKEYVIDTPRTPLPWINYLGTNGFFSLISNTQQQIEYLYNNHAIHANESHQVGIY